MSYEVKILKLVTGEEVLAKVEDDPMSEWTILKDARTLGFRPDGSAGMMPLVQMAPDRPVRIKPSAVIAEVFPVDPEMEKKYLSDTSGIAML